MKSPTPVSTPTNEASGLKATLDGLRSVLVSASSDYAAARRAIEQLKREREEIACAPAHRDDLQAALMELVDYKAANFWAILDERLGLLARCGLERISKTLGSDVMVGSQEARYFGSYVQLRNSGSLHTLGDRDAVSTGCLLALLGDEAVKTALRARIAALTIPNEGLPAAERQRKLADLDEQIELAEADLEHMRKTIESSGLRLADPPPPPEPEPEPDPEPEPAPAPVHRICVDFSAPKPPVYMDEKQAARAVGPRRIKIGAPRQDFEW